MAPSQEQVLLVFIYHHKEVKKTLSGAAKSRTELQEVWRKTNIPVKMEENIRAGIQVLCKEYQNQGKEKSRNTDKENVKWQIWEKQQNASPWLYR